MEMHEIGFDLSQDSPERDGFSDDRHAGVTSCPPLDVATTSVDGLGRKRPGARTCEDNRPAAGDLLLNETRDNAGHSSNGRLGDMKDGERACLFTRLRWHCGLPTGSNLQTRPPATRAAQESTGCCFGVPAYFAYP